MGSLVAFEGIDGSGKTTVARRVHDILSQEGFDVHATREPTDTRLGRRVREAIAGRVHPVSQALLFLADHRQHRRQVADRLSRGTHVISDRWSDSCFAYQSATLQGHVEAPLAWLLEGSGDDLRPDRVVLLDVDVETALSRVGDRGPTQGFERAELLGRVRDNYRTLADRFGNYAVVDGGRDLEAVVAEAAEVVREVLSSQDPGERSP